MNVDKFFYCYNNLRTFNLKRHWKSLMSNFTEEVRDALNLCGGGEFIQNCSNN